MALTRKFDVLDDATVRLRRVLAADQWTALDAAIQRLRRLWGGRASYVAVAEPDESTLRQDSAARLARERQRRRRAGAVTG